MACDPNQQITQQDLELFKANINAENEHVNSPNDTFIKPGGGTGITQQGIENAAENQRNEIQFLANAAISAVDGVDIGVWTSGVTTYNNYNEYATFDRSGTIERWYLRPSIPLGYTATTVDPINETNFVYPAGLVTEQGVINEVNAGDSQLAGGAIWPLSSQESVQLLDSITNILHIRYNGDLYKLNDEATGTVNSISLDGETLTIDVGGTVYTGALVSIFEIKTSSLKSGVDYLNAGFKSVTVEIPSTEQIGDPLIIQDVNGWTLKVIGEAQQSKHGYNGLIVDNCSDWEIEKSGLIRGHGSFPAKNIGSTDGGGEKRLVLDNSLDWESVTGNVDRGLGSFGGGFIGCMGSGVSIRNGCRNFYTGISVTGFNGNGVSVGDYRTSKADQNEPLNTDGTVDGELYGNYNAGFGHLACDNIRVADTAYIHNNGHPDALESDQEINPGYGTTSNLVSNSGNHSRNCTIGNCRLINNNRKGFDIHSGINIRCESPLIEGSMVQGISYGGASGVRNGGGWSSPKIVNCAFATGSVTDTKNAISVSDNWEKIVPDGVPEIKNSGITYTIYWKARNSTLGPGVNIDNTASGWIGGRPIYVQGAMGDEQENNLLLNVQAKGVWQNPCLFEYCTKSMINGWLMEDATINSSLQQIQFTECDMDIGKDNRWRSPQFNNGNIGRMEYAKSEVSIAYNGTNIVADIAEVTAGNRYVEDINSGGAGLVIRAIASTDDPGTSPPFEHTSQCSDATLSGATFANVDYDKVRCIGQILGGRQEIIVSPRDNTGATIPIDNSKISELRLNVQINWKFQK